MLRIGFTEDRITGKLGNILGKRFPTNLTSQLWIGHWENIHAFEFNTHRHQRANLIWGIDAQQQHADSPDNPYRIYAWTTTVVSPLIRAELEWNHWLASTEVRFDHYDQFGDHTVFNVNLGWRFNPEMSVWLKGGTGYRAPSVNERLHPLFGAPTITPERSTGGEIGWRWQFSARSEFGISGSLQNYHNLIVLQQDTQTGVNKTSNFPQARVWSAELHLQHAWNESWSSGLNYTFMTTLNPQTGLQVAQRPKHQGLFWNEWRILAPLRLRVDLTFRDSYWSDPLNTIRIKSAPRLNAQLNYQATPQVRLYVRGENLNDERTPDLQGFNYIGASVYGGMSLDW